MITIPSQSWLGVAMLYGAVMAVAAMVARLVPAYRRELHVEADTRMLALDGVRGLLCFGVLLHHAAMTLQIKDIGGRWDHPHSALYLHLGRTAVALFFCITGFLFWGRVLRTNGKLPVFEFFRGRIFRVVPLYAFAALIVAAIAIPAAMHIGASKGQLARFLVELSTVGLLPWHSIVTATGGIWPESINAGVHWSLRYEWAFYLALPILGLAVRRTWMLYAMFAASVAALIASTALGRGNYLTMFPIGMLAAHVVRRFPLVTELRRPRYAVLVCLATAALLILAQPAYSPFAKGLTQDPTSPLCHLFVLAIFIPLACGNTIFGLLALPSLRLMGTISYSVYLLHGIVLYVSRPWLNSLATNANDSNLAYWAAIAGLGVVTLIIASATYLAVERPFILFDRHLRHKRSASSPIAPVVPAA